MPQKLRGRPRERGLRKSGRTEIGRYVPDSLDATVFEAIRLFASLLARTGASDDLAWRHFRDCLKDEVLKAPFRTSLKERAYASFGYAASDVLSVWHLCPPFVKDGTPQPLPVRGRISIDAMVQLVRKRPGLMRLDTRRVLKFLLASKCLRRIGRRYIPASRYVKYNKAFPGYISGHQLRTTEALLRTFEDSAKAPSTRWIAFSADGAVPEGQVVEFENEFNPRARDMMEAMDADMIRRTMTQGRREKTVPMTIAVFMSKKLPMRTR